MANKEEMLKVPFNKFNQGISGLLNRVVVEGLVLGVTYNDALIAVFKKTPDQSGHSLASQRSCSELTIAQSLKTLRSEFQDSGQGNDLLVRLRNSPKKFVLLSFVPTK